MTDGITSSFRLSQETYEVCIILTEKEIRILKQLFPNMDIETAIHELIRAAYYSTIR